MAEDTQPKKFDLQELRKIYPKAGAKWDKEDDKRLQDLYKQNRKNGADFNAFILNLGRDFQRAPGGLKARLAMHFTDVPGWDYGRDEFRKQELNKKALAAIPESKNEFLRAEYQTYVDCKTESYLKFLKRMTEVLGAAGELAKHRLEQLVGPLVRYAKDDVEVRRYRPAVVTTEPELPQLDLSNNPQMREALRVMEQTNSNLFLTGEAGTGKSTFLKYFRYTSHKNVVVLAPTGVAALNVDGQTIHSFCGFRPDTVLKDVKKLPPFSPKFKLLQKVQTIIIDEISMVRADLLDCVDKFLRLNGPLPKTHFGGIQMVFIGDLYQLPPVEKDFISSAHADNEDGYESPYFFHSKIFSNVKFEFIQLQTVYRQSDPVFLDVLNAVRNNSTTAEHLKILNQRALAGDSKFTFEEYAIYLTPHNAQAHKVNNFFLEKLTSPIQTFTGRADGKFEGRELPTDLELRIKIGAQIMMLNNDPQKRWVNGTMGKVIGINNVNADFPADSRNPDVVVELETGQTVYVEPHTWEMYQFSLNGKTQTIESRVAGSFTQYPFKLAWAVTIHKAQGKTFDKVYVDLSTGTFAHGQLYVALSRCRTLEGLFLRRPITQKDIILDNRIVEFLKGFNSTEPYYSQEIN